MNYLFQSSKNIREPHQEYQFRLLIESSDVEKIIEDFKKCHPEFKDAEIEYKAATIAVVKK